jgi:hypothetical protein
MCAGASGSDDPVSISPCQNSDAPRVPGLADRPNARLLRHRPQAIVVLWLAAAPGVQQSSRRPGFFGVGLRRSRRRRVHGRRPDEPVEPPRRSVARPDVSVAPLARPGQRLGATAREPPRQCPQHARRARGGWVVSSRHAWRTRAGDSVTRRRHDKQAVREGRPCRLGDRRALLRELLGPARSPRRWAPGTAPKVATCQEADAPAGRAGRRSEYKRDADPAGS